MSKNTISDVSLVKTSDKFRIDENVAINVKFSITGDLRDAFNEKIWEQAYNKHDNAFKLKYGIKLHSGGLRKKQVGTPVDTYRKAALFWTRNPKLTQMAEKKIWVQIAKNFEPFIPMTEAEAKSLLLDFDEKIQFSASELGVGKHKISAEVYASWNKHDYTDDSEIKANAKEIEIEITK